MTKPGFIAPIPVGGDYVSALPGHMEVYDRALGQGVRIRVASEAERDTLIPSPGLNERWQVYCPTLSVSWQWDGARWLVFDDRPVEKQGYWYDGTDLTPLSVGDGGWCKAWYQRQGHMCDLKIVTYRGSNAHVGAGGGEKYFWYCEYPPFDMYETGTSRVRLVNTTEYSGTAGFINNTLIFAGAMPNGRLNKDSVAWTSGTAGDHIMINMRYRMKV